MAANHHAPNAIALANTATLNKLTDTIVGVWDLEHPGDEHAPKAEAMLYTNPGDESVLGEDERQPVHPQDFGPGGKYRCKYVSPLNIDRHTEYPHRYCQALLPVQGQDGQ